MGDLAQAIVDLGINADRRRQARKTLKFAVETVVSELLRHLRVGDWVILPANEDEFPLDIDRTYRVEKITWDVIDTEPYGPDPDTIHPPHIYQHEQGATTLVRYDGLGLVPRPATPYDGAVLLDPRRPMKWDHPALGELTHAVHGRGVYLFKSADDDRRWQTKLHLATDADLAQFADEAVRVAREFTKQHANQASLYSDAAGSIMRMVAK